MSHIIGETPRWISMQSQRVFVAGHSFLVPLLPEIDRVVRAAGIAGHEWVGQQMIGASSVTQQWDLPEGQNVAKEMLLAGKVDVLMLSPNWIVPDIAIANFVSLGIEKNPDMRVLVQVSWYPWDGLNLPEKVVMNEDRDVKGIAEMRAVYDPYRDIVGKQVRDINTHHGQAVAFVVPVGEAVLRLREMIIAAQVPSIIRQSELFVDEIGHGAEPVLQLAAYCQFASLYRRSPVGLLCFEETGDEASQRRNRLLQTIAWEAVLDEPLSGVGEVSM